MNNLQEKLRVLLNKYSVESKSNTPDFILAKYIMNCLDAFTEAVQQRDDWYHENHKPVDVVFSPSKAEYTEDTSYDEVLSKLNLNPTQK